MLSQVVKCDDSDADELAAGSSRLDPARILNVTLLDHGHCGRWPSLKHQSYYNRSFLSHKYLTAKRVAHDPCCLTAAI